MFIPKNLSHLKSYTDKQFSLLMYKNQIRLLSKSNDHELKSNAKKYKQLERLIDNNNLKLAKSENYRYYLPS